MRTLIITVFLFSSLIALCQAKRPQDFGFRHLQTNYEGDLVDILIKSRTGEELVPKPLFLFCQGSLPQPLIKYDDAGMFGVFPFNPDSLTMDFHLVIIGKPNVPVLASVSTLGSDFTYTDTAGLYPQGYVDRNFLDYYVNRNVAVIKYLSRQKWVASSMLVVGGHSEGSTIAAKLALVSPLVTHLIYSGGNPMGRMSTIVQRLRNTETDSTNDVEAAFDEWRAIVADPSNTATKGDTHKATYQFSIPPFGYLQELSIPVLVSYGTRDAGAPFNDYLALEMIRRKKQNFTFKAYVGTEHNYFSLNKDGSVDHSRYNWDTVADDWRLWLRQHRK